MDIEKVTRTDKWYIGLVAVSAAVLVAGLALTGDPLLRRGLVWVAIGGLLIGLGEWKNHPYQERIGYGFKLSGYTRQANLVGVLMVIAGCVLLGRGLWLLW